ncbi:MAG: RcnB family protein [Rhizomicrobium sp.]
MKRIVLPALSLALLAAMPAQASAQPYMRVAQNDADRAHRGDVHPSPPTPPAGGAPTPSAHDRVPGGGQAGGAHPAAGGAGATHGGGNAHAGGGAPPGGANPTGGGPAGGANHGAPIDRTAGGLLIGGQGGANQPGGRTPPAGHPGGAPTGTGHPGGPPAGAGHPGGAATPARGGNSAFGTRPSNWNQFPRTFDRGTYQRNVTASRHFHWQTYTQPSGWYYRRWVFGQVFPKIFWAQNYWLTDYWMFDLPVPPYGYVWVRYGDDAVLVNKQTGVVLQVVYGLFD